jgi:hypothetical protein
MDIYYLIAAGETLSVLLDFKGQTNLSFVNG